MKIIVITSIAAIALTHAAHARTWAWFHGDIGVTSSFSASSNPVANPVSTPQASKRKAVSKQVGVKSKSKSASQRIAAR